jgi:23S rRNA (uracil1939-C5)-methyltransferase
MAGFGPDASRERGDPLGLSPGSRVDLEVSDLAYGGAGVARYQGLVVLVELALPGEKVRAEITQRSRRFARAKVLEILNASPARVEPPCRHFLECGGCAYQILEQADQLLAKRAQVRDLLERIGKIPSPTILPTWPSTESIQYRRRMSYTVGVEAGGGMGLHGRATGGKVLEVPDCLLPTPDLQSAYRKILVDLRSLPGAARPRRVELQAGSSHPAVAVMRGPGAPSREVRAMAEGWVLPGGFLLGVAWMSDVPRFGPRGRGPVLQLSGASEIEEELSGFTLRFPAGVFFQANPLLAASVFELIADKCRGEDVLELFAGMGALTVHLARKARSVVAVEGNAVAARAATENIARNGLRGVEVVVGSVERALEEWMRSGNQFEAIVLDPPRSGLPRESAEALSRLARARILYLSCDPATMARDVRVIVESAGWAVREVRPVDFFPHTAGIECLVEMVRHTEAQTPRSRISPA